ncbi:MAG: hypothetical protein HRT61_09035 [Ekhidna sp.]|nr:hypothetical protein [Ekhidna sp.]
MKKLNYQTVIIIVFLVLILVAFVMAHIYPHSFLFFEEMRVFEIYNFIFIPILSFMYLKSSRNEFVKLTKRGSFRLNRFIKSRFISLAIHFGFYIFILRTTFISIILYINSNIGNQTNSIISGVVIEKTNKPVGGRTSEIYRLTIKSHDETIFNLTTTKTLVQKYQLGQKFHQEMNEGSLGFFYLKE